MPSSKELAIYLNDHLAGSAAGTELADKIAEQYVDTTMGPSLAALARDIHQDQATLARLLDRLGIEKSTLKQAAGWIAEKLSRLKMSDVMTGHEDLKRLLEFETLGLGIEGKLSMWRALIEVTDSHPALATTDLAGLAKRAENQRANLEDHRLAAAKGALAG